MLGLALLAALLGAQQGPLDPRSSIKIDLPADSPLSLVSADVGESRATARGGAAVLDLHMMLTLRNSGSQNVRAITLLVLAQEVTAGGKASVTAPSLSVGPGEVFPVRVDLRLLRPLQPALAAGGPLVQVRLDGVLFEDFSFYGPNRLNSRRAMTVWETEAERDRRYFKSVLAEHGPRGLQREALDSLARQAARPRVNVQVVRSGRAVSSAVADTARSERPVQFAFLRFPDSPLDPLSGRARISGNEARAPRIAVRNRSSRPIRYFEIGWIVRDTEGREFLAASIPASIGGKDLAPGEEGQALEDTALRFSGGQGTAIGVSSMTGFVSQAEYADGKIWIPDRPSLTGAGLLDVLAPSAEEQRLTSIYHNKGLEALIEELKKF